MAIRGSKSGVWDETCVIASSRNGSYSEEYGLSYEQQQTQNISRSMEFLQDESEDEEETQQLAAYDIAAMSSRQITSATNI